MNVMLNKHDVVIDIVETVKPVKKNKNGVTVLCDADVAEGYIGSDNESIIPKQGMQFQPTYYDIAKIFAVDEIPAQVETGTYKYTPEDGFFLNEDIHPNTNMKLTERTSDLEDVVLEMSEIIYS